MRQREYYSGNFTNESVSWYWENGLHDAEIINVEELELPYDYKTKNPLRTCLVIHLNSIHALYSRLKRIYLYNYKIVKGDIHAGRYWMCDKLTMENSRYFLAITLTDDKNDFDTVICFETAKTE